MRIFYLLKLSYFSSSFEQFPFQIIVAFDTKKEKRSTVKLDHIKSCQKKNHYFNHLELIATRVCAYSFIILLAKHKKKKDKNEKKK